MIAFSTFNETPPDNSRYGRVGGGDAGNAFEFPQGPDYEVFARIRRRSRGTATGLCDAACGPSRYPGVIGVLLLQTYGGLPPTADTPWVQPQDHYTGRCVTDNGANVLFISPVGDARQLNPSPEPGWGLHLTDVNIGLGNLLRVLTAQKRRLRRRADPSSRRGELDEGLGGGGRRPSIGASPASLIRGSSDRTESG